jgi:hypothetical protein
MTEILNQDRIFYFGSAGVIISIVIISAAITKKGNREKQYPYEMFHIIQVQKKQYDER